MKNTGEKILKQFFINYLILNDVEEVEKLISEKFKGVGTSKFEIAQSKDEFVESIKEQISNLNDRKINFYIKNYTENCFGDIISSYCEMIIICFNKAVEEVTTRLTTVFVKEENEWKIINMHNSMPEIYQKKEEIFPDAPILDSNGELELFLSSKSKRVSFKLKDVNYIAYSSVNRTASFYLEDLKSFDVRRNFSEIEEKIKNLSYFYKLDRGTMVNLDKIEMLDLGEEKIVFKNKQELYMSKVKLRELERAWIKDKNKIEI